MEVEHVGMTGQEILMRSKPVTYSKAFQIAERYEERGYRAHLRELPAPKR